MKFKTRVIGPKGRAWAGGLRAKESIFFVGEKQAFRKILKRFCSDFSLCPQDFVFSLIIPENKASETVLRRPVYASDHFKCP